MPIHDERRQQTYQALMQAGLTLSLQGHAFSHLSLRELTRSIGLVPAAFYRHFPDMLHLGAALVEHAALRIKAVFAQMQYGYMLKRNESQLEKYLLSLLQHFEQQPEVWNFFIAERWGGSVHLRDLIEHEIQYLTQDLSQHLSKSVHKHSLQYCQSGAEILINIIFTWAMQWLQLRQFIHTEQQLKHSQQQHLRTMTLQIQVVLGGLKQLDEKTALMDG